MREILEQALTEAGRDAQLNTNGGRNYFMGRASGLRYALGLITAQSPMRQAEKTVIEAAQRWKLSDDWSTRAALRQALSALSRDGVGD